MKKIILFLFSVLLSFNSYAEYVRGYIRRDGTYVSGYQRKPRRSYYFPKSYDSYNGHSLQQIKEETKKTEKEIEAIKEMEKEFWDTSSKNNLWYYTYALTTNNEKNLQKAKKVYASFITKELPKSDCIELWNYVNKYNEICENDYKCLATSILQYGTWQEFNQKIIDIYNKIPE